jgi:hypothetical protein
MMGFCLHSNGWGSEYARLPNGNNHANPGLDDFTFTAWVLCSSTIFGYENPASDLLIWFPGGPSFQGPPITSYSSQFRVRGDTGRPEFYFQKSGGESKYANVIGSVRVSDDKWHHLAVSCDRDAANGFKIYVDGQDVTDAGTGSPDPTPFSEDDFSILEFTSVQFCNYFGEPDDGGYGRMDQIRFYRTVLTPLQIAAIYNNGRGLQVNEAEFAQIADGWYSELDDGEGATASGRVCVEGVWGDSPLALTNMQWISGGIPFPKKGLLSLESLNDVWENW